MIDDDDDDFADYDDDFADCDDDDGNDNNNCV